jgi:hypothetical protein
MMDKIELSRRDALAVGAGGLLLAAAPGIAEAAPVAAPEAAPPYVMIYDEPGHHFILENGYMRVMRVMIRPGEQTLWHEQHLTYVNTILHGSQTLIQRVGEGPAVPVDMVTGTIRYGAYADKPIIDQVSNVGSTAVHQVAFEILRPAAGHFGAADRSAATAFTLALDKPRVRGWRLKLQPGETTARYTQDGPGLRVVFAGERLIETTPGEMAQQTSLRPDDAMFTLPGTRTLTNASQAPLDIMEYELL